jgi:FtsP/CotA-like multicopper oxidase with cupredoxin domain
VTFADFFFFSVNGITECPIEPGATRRYQFVATQHGTSWYHSHYSGQYGDGVLGTIKINGPAYMNYEEDLGTFPITDWYTENMYAAGFKSEPAGAAPPRAKGALINGKMKSAPGSTGIGAYEDVKIVKGKTYRLRLINTSVDMGYKVSLDNHRCKYKPSSPFCANGLPGGFHAVHARLLIFCSTL